MADGDPDPFKAADRVTGGAIKKWWAQLAPNRKTAWTVLLLAGAIGPLATPVVSLLADAGKAPGTKNLAACAWLIVITLPVAAAAGFIIYLGGKTSGAVLAWSGAVAAVVGLGLMNALIGPAGASLKGFYCYNNGTLHENACRALSTRGVTETPYGAPSHSATFVLQMFAAVADARGFVMALCGVLAGGAAGYLLRDDV
jgi:hypothetical protein